MLRCSPLRRSRSRKRPEPVPAARPACGATASCCGNLIRKELKVKYKNSVLGFVWTLLNPMLYLVVFSIVFQEVLQVQVPYFAIFFLSGLLAWNLFATALGGGTGSIVGNASLVQKVWFPREILPLAADRRGAGALLPPGDRAARRAGRVPAGAGLGATARSSPRRHRRAAAARRRARPSLLSARQRVPARHRSTCSSWPCWRGSGCRAIVYPYRLVADRLGAEREWLGARSTR